MFAKVGHFLSPNKLAPSLSTFESFDPVSGVKGLIDPSRCWRVLTLLLTRVNTLQTLAVFAQQAAGHQLKLFRLANVAALFVTTNPFHFT